MHAGSRAPDNLCPFPEGTHAGSPHQLPQLSTPRSRQDTDFSLEGALADLGGALTHGYIPRTPSGSPHTHTDTEEPQ